MSLTYTYWQAPEGGCIGYWNDYPDYLTEGETVEELQYMLRDLRDGINVMVAEGEIPSAALPLVSRSVNKHIKIKAKSTGQASNHIADMLARDPQFLAEHIDTFQ